MDNEIRLALVGKTGSGRSTLGNMILQKECFPSVVSADSITEKCLIGITNRDEISVVVVDTPGLFHTKMTPEFVNKELQKVPQLLTPGPNAFLYTLRIGRYSAEEQQTLDTLVDLFGENFYNFCVVVIFTGSDKEMKQDLSALPTFYTSLMSRCNKRVLLFNNKSLDYNRLLSLVDSIEQESYGPYYCIERLLNSKPKSNKLYRLLIRGWIRNEKNKEHIIKPQKSRGCFQYVILTAVAFGAVFLYVTRTTWIK